MDNQSIQKLKDLINQNDSVAIAVGKNPTLDEMGAALGLFLSLESLGKKVTIACPTDPLVEISSLVGIDRVQKDLGGTDGDLVVAFPYREGEIDKVSYTIDGGFLNIVVKAGELGLGFSEADVQYRRGGSAAKVLFIMGTARLSDLGTLFDAEGLKETTVVNIDNKPDNQGFGDLVFVSPRFSSVSEQVADILTYTQFPIDVDIAQNLLSGIVYGTENFQSPTTSFVALEAAAALMKKGARREVVRSSKAPVMHVQDDEYDEAFMQAVAATPAPISRQRSQQSNARPASNQGLGYQDQSQVLPQAPKVSQSRPVVSQADDDKNPPEDWLAPKVYRGSTNLS